MFTVRGPYLTAVTSAIYEKAVNQWVCRTVTVYVGCSAERQLTLSERHSGHTTQLGAVNHTTQCETLLLVGYNSVKLSLIEWIFTAHGPVARCCLDMDVYQSCMLSVCHTLRN